MEEGEKGIGIGGGRPSTRERRGIHVHSKGKGKPRSLNTVVYRFMAKAYGLVS